jgi:hypothetical protein
MTAIRIAGALLLLAATATAQTIVNGRLEQRQVSGPIEREFTAVMRDGGAAWVGYAVRRRERSSGDPCWNAGMGSRVTPIRLESSLDLYVLFRVQDRAVSRIEVASPDCALDAGGLTLHWLANVSPTASLDWLSTFTRGEAARRVADNAVLAIALHGDPSAVDRLVTIAREGTQRNARSTALFWVSQRAGERAAASITNAIENDPDTQVKRQAVFALSQLPRGEGVPRLIDVARSNRNPEVRKQAMFWLGQSQDPRALAFFEEVLRSR